MLDKIPFAILEKSFLANSSGVKECSLIELCTEDFNKLTDIHNMIASAGFALTDRFLFRNALVLRNDGVEKGTIRTFNRRLFRLQIFNIEELIKEND